MPDDKKIAGWWTHLRRVLLRPSWEFITTGVLATALYVGTWWRDNTLAKEHVESFATQKFLPHWNPAWWICFGLGIALFLTIRESFHLVSEAERSLHSLSQSIPFPDIDIEAEYGLWVKNLSPTEAVFNIKIPTIETLIGVSFRCVPESMSSIAASKTGMTEIEILSSKEHFSNYKNYMIDIGKLAHEKLAPGRKEPVLFATIVVFCEDARKNCFRFDFPLSYNPEYMNKLPRFFTGTVKRQLLVVTGQALITSNK